MFLHRVKTNWKKHRALTLTILLVALARIVLQNALDEAPLDGYAILQIGVRVLIATVASALLKTCWELGTVYYKRLRTFMGALRDLPQLLEQNGGSVNGADWLIGCQVISQSGPGSLEPGAGEVLEKRSTATGREDREVSVLAVAQQTEQRRYANVHCEQNQRPSRYRVGNQ